MFYFMSPKIVDNKVWYRIQPTLSWVHACQVCVCVCVCVCARVSAPEAINYIHVILNLYNQLNKFVMFRNVKKLSMHGRGLCNKHVVTETKAIRLC